MYDIENISTQQAQSHDRHRSARMRHSSAATPERGDFDPREVFDRDEAITPRRAKRSASSPRASHPDGFQLADEREHLLWGIVNAFYAQVRQARPHRRPPRPRAPRPASGAGRLRSEGARARTHHRPRPQPRRPPRRLRDNCATPSPGSTAADDRRGLAPAARQPHQPNRRAHLGGHRCPRLPPRTQGPRDEGAPARGNARRHRRRQGRRRRRGLPQPRQDAKAKYADLVLVHGGGPGRGAHRRPVGRAARRASGRVQARLGPTRTGRTVPPKRRAAEPPAQGRHRSSPATASPATSSTRPASLASPSWR